MFWKAWYVTRLENSGKYIWSAFTVQVLKEIDKTSNVPFISKRPLFLLVLNSHWYNQMTNCHHYSYIFERLMAMFLVT